MRSPAPPTEVPAAAAFHPDARTKELCREYERLLGEAFGRERDACFEDASVLEVAPHPDVRSVLVIVIAPSAQHVELRAALEASRERWQVELGRARGGDGPVIEFTVMPPADPSS